MTTIGLRQLVLSLALLGMLEVRAEPRTLGGAQSGSVLPPPRAGLTPVHQPDLKELEPKARDKLISLQDSLAAQAKDTATTELKLSEAYGLMGQVYQAYSLTSP